MKWETFLQENLVNIIKNSERLWHLSHNSLSSPAPSSMLQKLYPGHSKNTGLPLSQCPVRGGTSCLHFSSPSPATDCRNSIPNRHNWEDWISLPQLSPICRAEVLLHGWPAQNTGIPTAPTTAYSQGTVSSPGGVNLFKRLPLTIECPLLKQDSDSNSFAVLWEFCPEEKAGHRRQRVPEHSWEDWLFGTESAEFHV